MLIAIFGENCSGKSSLAERMKEQIGAKLFTGKDYLRLASSESEALHLFRAMLSEAVEGENLIYVCSEQDQLALLPQGARRIYVKADLDTIKERFRARMHGNLPPPVEAMLERKHGAFENEAHDFVFDGVHGNAEEFCNKLFKE